MTPTNYLCIIRSPTIVYSFFRSSFKILYGIRFVKLKLLLGKPGGEQFLVQISVQIDSKIHGTVHVRIFLSLSDFIFFVYAVSPTSYNIRQQPT